MSEYLAEYGKPPREAVRALLDPSDTNIAAWIRKQRQVIAIASYVAARMTEMQSRLEADDSRDSPMPVSQIPLMMQMRATLYLTAADASSLRAARALQQVVTSYPSIDARLVLAGPPPDGRLSSWLLTLGTVLPVSILSPDAIEDTQLPFLLIEDLRYGSSTRLIAAGLTPRQIRDQIVALRVSAEARDRSSNPAAASQ